LEEATFLEWNKRYKAAQTDMVNRDEMIQSAINDLEQGMELLGVTGVEDKLQDDVEKTIESLRQAGI